MHCVCGVSKQAVKTRGQTSTNSQTDTDGKLFETFLEAKEEVEQV